MSGGLFIAFLLSNSSEYHLQATARCLGRFDGLLVT